MRKIRTQSKKFALLAVAAIALVACGGSIESSSSSSTASVRTKNVALTTTTIAKSCALGGPCVVGDIGPGGGKVFHVGTGFLIFSSSAPLCANKCKYLEAALPGWIVAPTPAGQTNCAYAGTGSVDPKCTWAGNYSDAVGSTSESLGAGFANTETAISRAGGGNTPGKAVTVARAFRGGGKTDWFLPSKEELSILHWRKAVVGGFGTGCYWSSSQGSQQYTAWGQFFSKGMGFDDRKSNDCQVRPIRAF